MSTAPEVIRQRLLARVRLRHWLGFARVAELGSVRRAAESIGLAQPALTGLLAELERLLEAPLFQRHAKGMRLTALGHELLPTARRVLGAMDDAAEQAAAMQASAAGVVRIAAIGGAVAGLLAPSLPALAAQQPQLLVQVQETDAAQLDLLVARGDIDIGLGRPPHGLPEGWAFEPLMADRLAVVAGPAHPLADARRVPLAELRRQTWLALPVGSAAQRAFNDLLCRDGHTPRLCQVSSRIPAVLWAMLVSQPLLALVPASVVRQLLAAGTLVEIRISQRLPLEPLGAVMNQHPRRDGVDIVLAALRALPPLD